MKYFLGICFSLSLFAAQGKIALENNRAAPGSTLGVSWDLENSPSEKGWLGLFVTSFPTEEKDVPVWKMSLAKKPQDKTRILLPEEPGQYVIRLFSDAEEKNYLSSEAINVQPILVTPSAVKTGDRVTVSFSAPDHSSHADLIALYAVGNSKRLWKQATNGILQGTFRLPSPKKSGRYEFRYFNNGKEVRNLRSPSFSVVQCLPQTRSKIQHLVILVSENHSFDSYFGRYCEGATGTNLTCTEGAKCCERGPETTPGSDVAPLVLNDKTNSAHDPNHQYDCNIEEINGGKMDKFISGTKTKDCADPRTFAYADKDTVGKYWELAKKYSMGDRVFQSVAGASSSNNMYLLRANFVFLNNTFETNTVGGSCAGGKIREYFDTTVGDLLNACGTPWSFYAERYAKAAEAHPKCVGKWPEEFDPGDIPTEYYPAFADKPQFMKDYTEFIKSLKEGSLPAVAFVKGSGLRSEHPKETISEGVGLTTEVLEAIASSRYAENTLLVLTPDEGGGFFDHVPPPRKSSVDGMDYGVRIFLMALGHFAKQNYISHVPMEHSSLVKFIEWNWLGGKPGQLGTRDAIVNNIGSLLDAKKTGVTIPE